MKTSLVYKHPFLYALFMRILYGKGYHARFEAIAKQIPDNAKVLDVCCGDCTLYTRTLRGRVSYTGADINPRFLRYARKKSIKVIQLNVETDDLPTSDYVVMQASLYQFIPHQKIILEKLFAAATKAVIISEPILTLANSKNPIISFIARRAANPGTGAAMNRFNEQSLMQLFNSYKGQLRTLFKINGGREMVGVFDVSGNREKDRT